MFILLPLLSLLAIFLIFHHPYLLVGFLWFSLIHCDYLFHGCIQKNLLFPHLKPQIAFLMYQVKESFALLERLVCVINEINGDINNFHEKWNNCNIPSKLYFENRNDKKGDCKIFLTKKEA